MSVFSSEQKDNKWKSSRICSCWLHCTTVLKLLSSILASQFKHLASVSHCHHLSCNKRVCFSPLLPKTNKISSLLALQQWEHIKNWIKGNCDQTECKTLSNSFFICHIRGIPVTFSSHTTARCKLPLSVCWKEVAMRKINNGCCVSFTFFSFLFVIQYVLCHFRYKSSIFMGLPDRLVIPLIYCYILVFRDLLGVLI